VDREQTQEWKMLSQDQAGPGRHRHTKETLGAIRHHHRKEALEEIHHHHYRHQSHLAERAHTEEGQEREHKLKLLNQVEQGIRESS
jgi:hypothetical protein